MTSESFDQLEAQLRTAGKTFAYPSTPDIASSVYGRLTGERKQGVSALNNRRTIWVFAGVIVGLLMLILAASAGNTILNWFVADQTPVATLSPSTAVPYVTATVVPVSGSTPVALAASGKDLTPATWRIIMSPPPTTMTTMQ